MAPNDAGTRAICEMAAWQEGRAQGMRLLLPYIPTELRDTVETMVAEACVAAAEYRARHAALMRVEPRHG